MGHSNGGARLLGAACALGLAGLALLVALEKPVQQPPGAERVAPTLAEARTIDVAVPPPRGEREGALTDAKPGDAASTATATHTLDKQQTVPEERRVLLLDPGPVEAAALTRLHVRRASTAKGVGQVEAYAVQGGEQPWLELPSTHFEGLDTAGGAPAWRPGAVETRDGSMLGYVRVPVLLSEQPMTATIQWAEVSSVRVQWNEEDPATDNRVALVPTFPGPAWLEELKDLGFDFQGITRFRIRGKGPKRMSGYRPLLAGRYAWRAGAGGAGLEGHLDVLAGEQQILAVTPPPEETFMARIELDVRDATEIETPNFNAIVSHAERLDEQRAIPLDHGSQPGMWRSAEFALPVRGGEPWLVIIPDLAAGTWSDPFPRLSPKQPVARARLLVSHTSSTISVQALDETSGEVLFHAKVAHGRGLLLQKSTERKDGRLWIEQQGEQPIELIVAAEGYKTRTVEWIPGRSPAELDVRLERGLRERVLVFETKTMTPCAGVPINIAGRDQGVTDEAGVLWIEARGPMERPAVGSGWTVLHASEPGLHTRKGFERLTVGPQGWAFAVQEDQAAADR